MPVEQASTFQPVKALMVAFIGIGLAIGATILIQQLVKAEAVEIKLGDDIFEAGDPDNMAAVIRRDMTPILWPAVVGDRDIYLQHLGDDPLVGWHAFDARRPGTERTCTLVWNLGGFFSDPCDPSIDFDATGTGLPAYEVTIDNDLLFIDLNGVNAEAEE